MRQSSLDPVFLRLPVEDELDPDGDPTTGTNPEIAFKLEDIDPITGDWLPASWELIAGAHYATGPNGAPLLLAKASYKVWGRWTDANGLHVVRGLGFLDVY